MDREKVEGHKRFSVDKYGSLTKLQNSYLREQPEMVNLPSMNRKHDQGHQNIIRSDDILLIVPQSYTNMVYKFNQKYAKCGSKISGDSLAIRDFIEPKMIRMYNKPTTVKKDLTFNILYI